MGPILYRLGGALTVSWTCVQHPWGWIKNDQGVFYPAIHRWNGQFVGPQTHKHQQQFIFLCDWYILGPITARLEDVVDKPFRIASKHSGLVDLRDFSPTIFLFHMIPMVWHLLEVHLISSRVSKVGHVGTDLFERHFLKSPCFSIYKHQHAFVEHQKSLMCVFLFIETRT